MPSAVYPSKPSWQLQLDVWETNLEPHNNRSFVNWALYMYRGNSDTPWNNSGTAWSVSAPGGGSGTFGAYRFGSTGSGTYYGSTPVGGRVLIASGGSWVTHNPDGSGSITVSASHAAAATLGTANIGSTGIGLSTLKQAPGTPTNVVATRVSDTQINLTWENNYPSNGAPTNNQILRSINDGPYEQVLNISASESVVVDSAANQKIRYKVKASNSAGSSAESAASAPVYTTPGAPTGAAAVKIGLDIQVTFVENVNYAEHEHEVWHGIVTGGVPTWDGSPLETLASGVLSYLHDDPDPGQVHIYRVRAKAGSLTSGYSTTNSVQLLTAPNKPTVPAMPAYADKAADLQFAWVHNPVDTTPQTAYEFQYSTNGGSSWSTTGKVTSTASSIQIPANTYAADVSLTTRVRTWGDATTGGSDGTGASPWSDTRTVTYKTIPTATILAPAEGATLNDATLRVNLGFAQAEGATFVKAQLSLYEGASLLENLESAILLGITMQTPVQNGVSYTLLARVQDSNGLWSDWDSNSFDVEYLAPVPAVPSVVFLPETGYGQIDLTIADPGAGQDEAATVTIVRRINEVDEEVVTDYPVSAAMTFLDTTPVTHGTNTYIITTTSELGAQSAVTIDLVTDECRRAYLSKGPGFATVVVFGGNLVVNESLSVATEVVEVAGRTKPIGLYGTETAVQLKVSSLVFENFGSTPEQIRDLLLIPGKACYRDPSGRRVFGTSKGALSSNKVGRAELSFVMTETS